MSAIPLNTGRIAGRMGLQTADREEAGHLPHAHDGQEGEPRMPHGHHARCSE